MSSHLRRVPNSKALYLTFTLMFFCFGSISFARVVISLYALHLGASASAVGTVVGTLYIFPLLISWPVGRYSDRIGSRLLLLFATAFGAIAMSVPFFWRALPALFVAAITLGFAFTFYNVLLQNLVGILSKPHERARNFSNSSLVGATTNFLGPLLAGIAIDHLGDPIASLCVVGLTISAAALLTVWGRMLPGGRRAAGAPMSLKDTLRDREVLRILATSSLVQVGQDLFQFYIPVYGYRIGLSASAIGVIIAMFAAASFFIRFIMPALIARYSEERVLSASFLFSATGFLLAPFFESVIALSAISFLVGLGMGCGQPITTMLIFSRSTEGRSGETLGLRQTANNLTRVSAPALFGLVASVAGLPAVFWLSGLMMGGGGFLARPRRQDLGAG